MSLAVKFNNTEKYISSFSDRLVELLRIELERNRTREYKSGNISNKINYTGQLAKSLTTIYKDLPNGFGYMIEGSDYAQKLDSGGKVKADLGSLISWVKNKPVRLRDFSGRFVKITDAKIKSLAMRIQNKLSTQGITPTNFIDDAIEIAMQKIDSIQDPMVKDVELNLDEIMIRAGYTKKGDDYIIK